jgi:hypothetical protein
MRFRKYQVTESAAGFAEGDVLDVTARYGPWHVNDMELELDSPSPGSRKVVVTEECAGFSESEILDPTARIGDWHEFDPGSKSAGKDLESTGPVRITVEELDSFTEPVGGPA